MRKIITDSAANLFADQINGVPHQSVALSLTSGGQRFADTPDFDRAAFAVFTAGKVIKTACPSAEQYLAAYGRATEVFVFTISAATSGSYNAARLAQSMAQEIRPEQKIAVFDTKVAGPAQRMLAQEASKLIQAGASFTEIVTQITAVSQQTKVFFALKTLNNLANNGRINKAVAKLAQVLKINVIGWADEQGEVQPLAKARGEKGARKALLQLLAEHNFDGQRLVIDHADNLAGALALQAAVQAQYPTCQVEIGACNALCRFYAEQGGLMIGAQMKG